MPDRAPPRTVVARLQLTALPGLPLVRPGDDLAELILAGLARIGESLVPGDVIVAAQKIVSKAEGRYADLGAVTPSAEARKLARETGKDPRLVELILGESKKVLRRRDGLLIVVHKLGFVLANAGIDHSNVEPLPGVERVLLLPEDPDASCARLRAALAARTGAAVGVIVNDSVGRAWRLGIQGIALGAAGLASVQDLTGRRDLFDRPLAHTQVGLADELAAAASLLQGQADEGMPVVLVRGLDAAGRAAAAAALVRPEKEDLFR